MTASDAPAVDAFLADEITLSAGHASYGQFMKYFHDTFQGNGTSIVRAPGTEGGRSKVTQVEVHAEVLKQGTSIGAYLLMGAGRAVGHILTAEVRDAPPGTILVWGCNGDVTVRRAASTSEGARAFTVSINIGILTTGEVPGD
jgi:hypothetical protein